MNDNPETVEVHNGQPPVMLTDARQRAELENQITTAKAYPRSITHFLREAMGMVTLNEEVASSCIYALPRGGKPIEGPSVRLAASRTVAKASGSRSSRLSPWSSRCRNSTVWWRNSSSFIAAMVGSKPLIVSTILPSFAT